MKMPQVYRDVMDRKHKKVERDAHWAWLCKHQFGTAKNITKTKDEAKLEQTIANSIHAFRDATSKPKPDGKGKGGGVKSQPSKGKGKGKGTHKNFNEIQLPMLSTFRDPAGAPAERIPIDDFHEGSAGLCAGTVNVVAK